MSLLVLAAREAPRIEWHPGINIVIRHRQSNNWLIGIAFLSKGKVISNRAAYLGETHQAVEGAIFDHQLLDVGQALVEIPVLRETLFRRKQIGEYRESRLSSDPRRKKGSKKAKEITTLIL